MNHIKGSLITLVLGVLIIVNSHCPEDQVKKLAKCSFRIRCYNTIKDVKLPDECQGSTNYPVRIDLTLQDGIESFGDELIEIEFLDNVNTLRWSGHLVNTTLPLIEHLPRLENIYIVNQGIESLEEGFFRSVNYLRNIDISHNKLKDLSNLFTFDDYPYSLTRLSLSHNEITEIPKYTFQELSALKELDLSYNQLSDLTSEPFCNLTNLETLYLSFNNIKYLNGAITDLLHLKHLYLESNNLEEIDEESLEIIYHLETFDVSKNKFSYLNPTTFLRHWRHLDNKAICKIILSQNQIISVPNAMSEEMTKRFTKDLSTIHAVEIMTELDLSKNIIEKIEYNAFQAIIRLVHLDLSENRLNEFVINPIHLVDIKFLNLRTNFIKYLNTKSFSPMMNLLHLDLSHNQLEIIPDKTFIYNHNLKHVNLSHNEIHELLDFRIQLFHPDGGALDISNNNLTKLSFAEGSRLTKLVLNSNYIIELSEINLANQNDLKRLIITNNKIQALQQTSMLFPQSLTYLNLSMNEVIDIGPSAFLHLTNLQTLCLSHNKLIQIELDTFEGLRDLKNLDLSYNDIVFLDSKALINLKSLSILSLKFNKLEYLDDRAWFNHKLSLLVYLEGNNLTCEWLNEALNNFENGYSKMRPAVVSKKDAGYILEGISCVPGYKSSEFIKDTKNNIYDENSDKLLVTNKKILEAVQEQNRFLRKFLWEVIQKRNITI